MAEAEPEVETADEPEPFDAVDWEVADRSARSWFSLLNSATDSRLPAIGALEGERDTQDAVRRHVPDAVRRAEDAFLVTAYAAMTAILARRFEPGTPAFSIDCTKAGRG